jgi:hypothetical protein
MATTLKTTISVSTKITQVDTDTTLTPNKQVLGQDLTVARNYEWEHGTTAGTSSTPATADLKFRKSATIGTGGNEVLDLNALLDPAFGGSITVNMVKIRHVHIIVHSTNSDGRLVVGNNASGDFQGWFGNVNDTLEVPAGGQFLISNPNYTPAWPCVNTSTDKLKLSNPGAGSVTYEIIIIGTSV